MADVRIVLERFSARVVAETPAAKRWVSTLARTDIPLNSIDDYEQLAQIAGLSVDVEGRRSRRGI